MVTRWYPLEYRYYSPHTSWAKVCLILHFQGLVFWAKLKTQNTLSAKICLNFHFHGGGGGGGGDGGAGVGKLGTKSQNRANWDF